MSSKMGFQNHVQHVKVGVILLGDAVQLLDVSPADLLGNLQRKYLRLCQLPEPVVNMGIEEIEYHFVNESGKGPQQMSGGFKIEVTDSIHTCPPLDILILGGPEPQYQPSPDVQAFLQKQYENVSAFMSICTGNIPAAISGIYKNKTVTGPRDFLPMFREQFKEAKWVDQRWARDGKLWTSGGVTNGLDLMAAYMRENFAPEIVEVMLNVTDVGDRGQFYKEKA